MNAFDRLFDEAAPLIKQGLHQRDIWYANNLDLAADIAQPAELAEWVAQRRELDLGHAAIDTAELVRSHYEDGAGRVMRPEILARTRMSGPRRSDERRRDPSPSGTSWGEPTAESH